MSHDHTGQDDPGRGRDEFDHFFSTGNNNGKDATDPDATAWSGAAAGPRYDGDRTQAVGHSPYVRPAQPSEGERYNDYAPANQGYDEYAPADQGYYPPVGRFEEAPQRRGAMWAPVAVIVASLAIVAVVIAIILNNSSGRMTEGAFTPTATVTRTTTQNVTPSQSSSGSQSSSSGSSSSSTSSSKYATKLPGDASACPGTSSYGTGPKTSCGFAGVVTTLYNAKKNDQGEASFKAKSPETHRNYAVSCHADSYVTCTTETGAVIYILRS